MISREFSLRDTVPLRCERLARPPWIRVFASIMEIKYNGYRSQLFFERFHSQFGSQISGCIVHSEFSRNMGIEISVISRFGQFFFSRFHQGTYLSGHASAGAASIDARAKQYGYPGSVTTVNWPFFVPVFQLNEIQRAVGFLGALPGRAVCRGIS